MVRLVTCDLYLKRDSHPPCGGYLPPSTSEPVNVKSQISHTLFLNDINSDNNTADMAEETQLSKLLSDTAIKEKSEDEIHEGFMRDAIAMVRAPLSSSSAMQISRVLSPSSVLFFNYK
jgi:hypothetical protein